MIRGHLVTVLGREIPVRSAAPEEKVREVEAFVNERIEAIRSRLTTADPQLLVTLALLNLSESYLELQHRQDGSGSTLEARLTSMLEQLDHVL
ncbi:cell division protein ZapA [Trichlorobacter lovleyi]|uniref:cell division protein ZapA n=1 Tax=Trichlorobacter lovleyi TaxID=313985 RepID=UPI00223F6410|nr:cell division protein ZapA [Trichlorobacter lovleyi]QOX80445.1 cell division protein ZapA [Trichlorobacter lovleyi]